MTRFEIDADIRRAATPPSAVYHDPAWFERQRERLFARSWQLVTVVEPSNGTGQVRPWTLLEGCLDEPLLLVRDQSDVLRCLSNVCTHRANLVVTEPGRCNILRCRYHGRRFALDGRFLSMPEFEQAQRFPSAADDLRRLPLRSWGPLRFTALDPAFDFDAWFGPVRERLGWLPFDDLVLDAEASRSYEVRAHWALYCDNYLEGFHIPYVHADLNEELDYGKYRSETFALASLQTGVAEGDEHGFELPADHPDRDSRVAAYYFFLFPNLALNFYPWGLSVNVVEPLGVDRTRVRYLTYVSDPSRRGVGAGADLHRVELEDETVVEACQRGVRSRLYERGRYSPAREQAVHHFHRLLAHFLCGDP